MLFIVCPKRMAEASEEIQFLTQWKLVRSAIEHENTLKSHRVTWFLASQLFLFTGFTSIFVEAIKNSILLGSLKVYAVLVIIFLMGIYVCILAWASLRAAQKMIVRLQTWWLIHCNNTSDSLETLILSAKYGKGQKSFPPVNGIFTSNMHMIFDETNLPVALALFWLVLFLVSTLIVLKERNVGVLFWLIVVLAMLLISLMIEFWPKRIVKYLRATSDRASDEFARIYEGLGTRDPREKLRKDVKNILDNNPL